VRAPGGRPRLRRLGMAVALLLIGVGAWEATVAHAERASMHGRTLRATRISAGGLFTCAITSNGAVRCWGYNAEGQLGYGNTKNIGDDETPGSVGTVDLGGHTAVELATGNSHTCALLEDRTVRCWGRGLEGQLGYGNTQNIGDNETPGSVGPVNLGTGRTAVEISSTGSDTCALLDNGTVKCWGFNPEGQLGYGNTTTIGDNETPASVGPVNLGEGRTAVAISTGNSHTCAILDNGTVRCWGQGTEGQLGYGNTQSIGDNETPASAGPVNLGAGRTAVALASGWANTCALLDNGSVRCWGRNSEGELGYGNTQNIGDNETPGSVGPVNLGTGRSAVSISFDYHHACAILDNGDLLCWGSGEVGQLGYGNTQNIGDNETPASAGPVDVGAGRRAVAVSAGILETCATLDNGQLLCWGWGFYGQLGYGNVGTVGDDESPGMAGPVEFDGTHGALETTAGGSHSCALMDDGAVRCWGLGASGQLGYGNTKTIGDDENAGAPGTVVLGTRSAVEVVAGGSHTCALLDDGTVRCWGLGASGQLGYGNTKNVGDDETPGSVGTVDLGAARHAVAIAAGTTHTCALLDDGTVRCWGLGSSGQLGYGNTSTIGDNETPGSVGTVDLGAGRHAVAISAGGSHTCALLDDGTLRCWGLGSSGQLGYVNTKTIGDDETPGSVGPLSLGNSAKGISTGSSHTCATLTDGTIRCWGIGTNGRLGYGNTSTIGDNEAPSSAGAVSAGRSAVWPSVGGSHSCAAFDNGTVKCWGLAASGQLGYADTKDIGDDELPSSVGAVDIGLGRRVLNMSAGENHTCATMDNATVRCWGLNANGQLGYGNTTTIGDNETPASAGPVDFVDDAPLAVNDTATVSEDVPTAIDVLANDTDVDGGPKTIASKTNGSHGAVLITGGGSGLTYTPDPNYCGSDSFTYELSPGTSQATVTVTVTCVDDPPVAVSDSTSLAEDSPATAVAVLANDTDIDGGPKTIQSAVQPAHGAVSITGGGTGLTYAPTANYCNEPPGTTPDTFSYTLNGGSTATVSVTVTCVDDAPVAVNDSKTLNEDAAAAIDVLANDTDVDGGPKTVASKSDPAHGTASITGGGSGLTYQPAANYCGPDSFTYTLNGGSTATVSVTVDCVDDPPVAVNDSATVTEDASPTVVDVLANDTDSDDGPRTIVSKTNGAHGTVAIIAGGLSVTYAPDPNYCGADSFTYTLNGGSTATVSITVSCVDDSPVAVDDSTTVAEDASPTAVDVLANDTDIDAGPKSVASKTNGSHGAVLITGGGTALTYGPDPNYCGADSFTYTLNGGSTATVSVAVSCVDDPPTAVADSKTLDEGSGATAIDVLANDTDIDGGTKTIASKTDPAHGTVAITGGGTGLTYAPSANYCGPDSFTYTLNGGSTATVSITVTCVDDPPVAIDDSKTLNEDSAATAIDVLANDTDSDGGPKSVASKANGSHGAVLITGGGAGLTYLPDANYCGPDSFTYTLNGGSTATVSITVTCVDDSPVAVNDSAGISEDASTTGIDVLANDTDIDGGTKTIASKTDPAHGTVAIAGGGTGLTYTPASNYCGFDSFTYTLNGGSTATVSITVTCVDDPPAAVNDSDTVAEDSGATAIDVLANDTDLDGGPKSIAGKTNGSHGAVTTIGGGAGLTYQPDPNYCGPDSFTYTLNGGSAATVTITVTCVEEPVPPGEGGSGGGPGGGSSTQNIIQNPAASGPVVNITPGVGVVSGRRHPRIAVKGAFAFFTLTCRLADRDCSGTVTISASVPSIALGPTMRKVVMVKGRFRIGSNRSVLVRARLTKRGKEALETKQSLRGVASTMAIVDAVNGEHGEIVVNLVRRPKASLLGGTPKP
jgi:alpha-tubulin suppressor-like RCC1 family protein